MKPRLVMQISEWSLSPLWRSGGEGHERAAQQIIRCSVSSVPSVLTARHVDANGLPARLPSDLSDVLAAGGVHRLVVGHTVHGHSPTVVQGPVQLVMGGRGDPDATWAREYQSAQAEALADDPRARHPPARPT